MTDATVAATTYFEAWQARDFARLRSVLADDVDFAGPLGQVKGGDECQAGIEGMSRIMTSIEVRKVFDAGPDVLTWFDLATSVAETVPVILPGFSDSRWFRDAFPECVAYGFFPQKHQTLLDCMPLVHSANERIDVRDLGFAASCYADLAQELLG